MRRIVGHAVLDEEFYESLFETSFGVMCYLVLDVADNIGGL